MKQFIENNSYRYKGESICPLMPSKDGEYVSRTALEAYMEGKVVVDKKFIKALHDEATHNEYFPFELYLELDEMLSTQGGE